MNVYGISDSRAVGYGNKIIAFGGVNIYPTSTDINVIDTVTETINVGGLLAFAVADSAVIVVNNILYGFGGSHNSVDLDEYQYISLPYAQCIYLYFIYIFYGFYCILT